MRYILSLDESGDDGSVDAQVVAGYLFSSKKARELAHKWRAALAAKRLPFFHMVDCAHRSSDFKAMSAEEAVATQTEFMKLIRAYSDFLIATSAPVSSFVGSEADRTPYGFCIHQAVALATHVLELKHGRGNYRLDIEYEAGHKHSAEAKRFLNSHPELYPDVKRFAFVTKQTSQVVQCADIAAWQFAKYLKCLLEGRAVRKDFLWLADQAGQFTTWGFEGNALMLGIADTEFVDAPHVKEGVLAMLRRTYPVPAS